MHRVCSSLDMFQRRPKLQHISLIERSIDNLASPTTLSSDMRSFEKLLCVLMCVEVYLENSMCVIKYNLKYFCRFWIFAISL